MSLKRIVLLAAVSCGAPAEKVARPEPPQPLPHHVEIVDASASAPATTACFASLDAGAADYASGRALFQAKKWADAAAVFRSIAFASPDDAAGIYAAELYIQSLYELTREGRKVCFDDMERDLPLVKAWCMPATQPSSLARCDELAYNAAVAYLATGDEAAAKQMRAIMIDPKNKMDKSPLIEKLDCRIDPASRPACH